MKRSSPTDLDSNSKGFTLSVEHEKDFLLFLPFWDCYIKVGGIVFPIHEEEKTRDTSCILN